MKWVNPGIKALFDSGTATQQANPADTITDTGYAVYIGNNCTICKSVNAVNELWFSYDLKGSNSDGSEMTFLQLINTANNINICRIIANDGKVENCILRIDCWQNNNWVTVYTTEKAFNFGDAKINIEMHFKNGADGGRVDVWTDTKLLFSYRHPTQFGTYTVSQLKIGTEESWKNKHYLSSFIYQDTRRIGLEKFKKLTIDPDTEQVMPQHSTINYTLSGLDDTTDYSDITGLCVVLQPTSKDGNITEGQFNLGVAEIGNVDVSSSSGKDYEEAFAEVNTSTTKPFTKDEINNKTLSLTVNGA